MKKLIGLISFVLPLQAQILAPILHGSAPSSGPSVAFDATNKTVNTLNMVTSASFTLTIVGNTNVGVAVGVVESVADTNVLTVTVGGSSAALVSGTSVTVGSLRSSIYCVAMGSTSGAQTVSVTGMTANDPVVGAVSFLGVNQTTPCAHGANTSGTAASGSLSVTSAAGDQALWTQGSGDGAALTGATQTERWNVRDSFTLGAGGQTAAGAVSVSGGWTNGSSTTFVISGVDIQHQ